MWTPGLALEALKAQPRLEGTAYDATYIALAARLGATLYTTDDRLLGSPSVKRLAVARHVRDYAGGT